MFLYFLASSVLSRVKILDFFALLLRVNDKLNNRIFVLLNYYFFVVVI